MSSLRILVVEDEHDIRTIVQLALERVGGFVVQCVGSGSEALAMATAHAPDLILLDVMMPGMDGPETLRALQALPATASTPVVFLTAKAQPHDIELLRGLGAVAVIVKPFDPMTLSETLANIWDNLHDRLVQ